MSKLYPTQNHPSFYHRQRFVYPVVSRRSGGVSIGINLSPSKRCNFACVYCQVHQDRLREAETLRTISPRVDGAVLESELRRTVEIVRSGALFNEERFAATPPEKRILRDFAFSGDGEPTLSPQFAETAALLARVRQEESLDSVKLILITNATTLQDRSTVAGCDVLAANNGEIWAKLDGGSEDDYRRMNRSRLPFETILTNLIFASKRWPLSIQTMFLAHDGEKPTDRELNDYIRTIGSILRGGGAVKNLQLYTVARPPIESNVTPLPNGEMDRLAAAVREKTGLPTHVFYSR